MTTHQIGSVPLAKVPAKDVAKGSKKASPEAVIGQFQRDTAAIDAAPDPFLARIMVHLLALMVICAVLWAVVVKMDRIVMAPGKIVSQEAAVFVQPLDTVMIKTVNVRAGDVVKPGDVLATLDPTFAQADVGQLDARLASVDAQIARLEAEYNDQPYLPAADTVGNTALQFGLWKERQAQYRAQLQSYAEKIARVKATIIKNETDRQHLAERLKVVREIEGMRSSLAASQTGSKLNMLYATNDRIDIERTLVYNENELAASRHELQSLYADQNVYIQNWKGTVIEELVKQRNEAASLREQLSKARKREELVKLEAGTEAVVLEVSPKTSVGSMAQPGEPLFKLFPLGAGLDTEISIDARDLAFVQIGDTVQIKLDAYPFTDHGALEGVVETISEDAFTDRNNTQTGAQPFYRARVRLTKTELRGVPAHFRLIPGMPLKADIKVGERRVISYFLRPILRGLNESMREP
ncbi:HlyD family type I secretion periplasmic adaptor subunit [Azospirillum doebereinerae]|uniref:Membrane fusion protein (MFP) family protein n=1 Tax=Azospirillum doebereinerae TaxID=92933 RepID=A0A433J6Z1_9PROT|nr:HlyD family type I secretion periplasmic adaptor subunit [Azospirillum doebereinerae]MCG5238931.1 HlyD family type I secretion periplasmic adaptor subunit [Azospirillum doebereinerae]RUQ68948.1 HlyD family type I secretion periplasmic adaptor subunit [Azospirillum doebereinerae]